MAKTIQADRINLHELKVNFGLKKSNDLNFFREWQDNLPQLKDNEKEALDSLKEDYLHLTEYSTLEPIVKMVVLSPLLKLAGFYREPFYLASEKNIEIISHDQQLIVRGRLDVLVFIPEFWIIVIETKRTQYSLEVGIPQALTYMLANPKSEKPVFGLVTNGREFQFLKLVQQDSPIYAISDLFSIYRGQDLFPVLQILKNLANLVKV